MIDQPQDRASIQRASEALRAQLRRHRCGAHLNVLSRFPSGCCKVASLLLAQLLADAGIPTTSIRYVWGERRDDDGNLVSHGWLVVDGDVIDITCDQFADAEAECLVPEPSTWHATFAPHHAFSYDDVMSFNPEFREWFARTYECIKMSI